MSYACPNCNSTELQVVVSMWAQLRQSDDNLQTIEVEGHEWDQHSPMKCVDCGHFGEASQFQQEQPS